jgi:hypothetical protein
MVRRRSPVRVRERASQCGSGEVANTLQIDILSDVAEHLPETEGVDGTAALYEFKLAGKNEIRPHALWDAEPWG